MMSWIICNTIVWLLLGNVRAQCVDNDVCIQARWGDSKYLCAAYFQYCDGDYREDMMDCCPGSCEKNGYDTSALACGVASTPEQFFRQSFVKGWKLRTEPDPQTVKCTAYKLVVSKSTQTVDWHSKQMGVFELQTLFTVHGKSVYKNLNGQYLYYWPTYSKSDSIHSAWLIGPDYTSDGAEFRAAGDANVCPQNSVWQEYYQRKWIGGVTVTAATTLPPDNPTTVTIQDIIVVHGRNLRSRVPMERRRLGIAAVKKLIEHTFAGYSPPLPVCT